MNWQHIKQGIFMVLEPYRQWIQKNINPLYLQIVGYVTTVLIYVIAVFCSFVGVKIPGEILWGILLVFAGIPEVVLIHVFHKTITRFGREFLPKWLDTTIIIVLFPITWWRFGPFVAAIGFVHYLSGHYGEKQTEESIL